MKNINFTNLTVIYDEKKVNKELCKKKSRQAGLSITVFCMLGVIVAYIIGLNINSYILGTLLSASGLMIISLGLSCLSYYLIYKNTSKSILFAEQMFKIKDIDDCGWYNERVVLRVKTSSKKYHYDWLNNLVYAINNDITLYNESDKSKPVHVYIDITDEYKTTITVKNKEKTIKLPDFN